MMYGGYGNGSGMWIMMFVVFLVFLVIFGGFAALMVMALRHGHAPAPPANQQAQSRGLAILDERLARGEISPEEYQNLRSMLVSGQSLGS